MSNSYIFTNDRMVRVLTPNNYLIAITCSNVKQKYEVNHIVTSCAIFILRDHIKNPLPNFLYGRRFRLITLGLYLLSHFLGFKIKVTQYNNLLFTLDFQYIVY